LEILRIDAELSASANWNHSGFLLGVMMWSFR
jgi:hypothetical protein